MMAKERFRLAAKIEIAKKKRDMWQALILRQQMSLIKGAKDFYKDYMDNGQNGHEVKLFFKGVERTDLTYAKKVLDKIVKTNSYCFKSKKTSEVVFTSIEDLHLGIKERAFDSFLKSN